MLFCFTYGDGVANVDVNALIKHHKKMNMNGTNYIQYQDGMEH